jgi:hypothetical protein
MDALSPKNLSATDAADTRQLHRIPQERIDETHGGNSPRHFRDIVQGLLAKAAV